MSIWAPIILAAADNPARVIANLADMFRSLAADEPNARRARILHALARRLETTLTLAEGLKNVRA